MRLLACPMLPLAVILACTHLHLLQEEHLCMHADSQTNRHTHTHSLSLAHLCGYVCVWTTAWCKIGVGICYDIRFPLLAQLYAKEVRTLSTHSDVAAHTTPEQTSTEPWCTHVAVCLFVVTTGLRSARVPWCIQHVNRPCTLGALAACTVSE